MPLIKQNLLHQPTSRYALPRKKNAKEGVSIGAEKFLVTNGGARGVFSRGGFYIEDTSRHLFLFKEKSLPSSDFFLFLLIKDVFEKVKERVFLMSS